MPIYTYKCKACDTPYQKVRGITEAEPEYTCDTCNNVLSRVYSSVATQFNGGGFYSTDKGASSAGSRRSAGRKEYDI